LVTLEEKLVAPPEEHPAFRDLLGVGLIITLALVLYRFWHVSPERYLTDVAGQMASFYLLPALGLCLALRCGAIDLSVWAVASLGGLIAAWCINAGAPPAWAFAAAGACGLAAGAFNAALVTLGRLPSPIITFVTALVIMWTTQAFVPGRAAAVGDDAFLPWQLADRTRPEKTQEDSQSPAQAAPELRERWLPINVTRMLIVGLCYAATMAALLAGGAGARVGINFGRRTSLFAALCTSGLLCGIAGACWLMEHNSAPVLTRPIGDLRVIAAPILAGAAFFAGRSRALLAGLCLPAAMLLATIWRQEVWAWNMKVSGYDMQLVQLAAMLIGAHLAMSHLLSGRFRHRWLAAASAATAAAGILTTASAAMAGGFSAMALIYVAGAGLWACGMAAFIASRKLGRV
jgi:ribose/xylose/arabinose/galactoside ABC-type transport system permease subunit